MNTKLVLPLIALAMLLSDSVQASHFGMEVPDPFTVFELPANPPTNVYSEFRLTEVVPNHRKRLRACNKTVLV